MARTLDAEEAQKAYAAVRILYRLQLIDFFIYDALMNKVKEQTGNG